MNFDFEPDIDERSVVEWHDREWTAPDGSQATVERVALKFCEEAGELAGAIVKHIEGRTDKEWDIEASKELGDVMITLCVLVDRMAKMSSTSGYPQSIPAHFWNRWEEVSQRTSSSYRSS